MLTFSTLRSGRNVTGVLYVTVVGSSEPSLTLSGHNDSIISATFSPDGKYISTLAFDGFGKLWNATSGEAIHTITTTGGQNWLTRFSPDSRQLLISSSGGKNNVI